MSQDAGERFRVRREAGRGKRAIVHEAIDTLLQRPVALKIASDASGNRFLLEEGQRLARVRSPYVASLYDVLPEKHCLVLEWLSGQTLRQALRTSSPLPFESISLWTTQLLMAVAATHAVDILHGDIKPENIWIDEHGQIKLFDFGRTPRPGGDATALYAPAEVLRGEDHSVLSDIYCVASVVFEMLTGHPPFDSSDASELAQRKARNNAPLVNRSGGSVNEQIEAWMARALQREPKHRFESATVAVEAWQRAATSMLSESRHSREPSILHPQELAKLVAAFADSGSGYGSVMTLTGNTGVGKTQLLRQLFDRLPDSTSTISLSGVHEHVEALSTWREAAHAPSSPVSGCKTAEEVISTLETRICKQDTLDDILISIDDFGQCDPLSRSLIVQLARRANHLRIGIVATTRLANLREALGDWCCLQDSASQALNLEPPGIEALQGVLAEPGESTGLPDALAAYVHAFAGGNPRYASHLVEDLQSRGYVQKSAQSVLFRVPDEDHVPGRSIPYIERTLQPLSPTQRQLLDVASLYGLTFKAQRLARRVETSETAIAQHLHEILLRTDILVEENGMFRFTTPLLQKYLENSLAPELRLRAHNDISNWLLEQEDREPGPLGRHLFLSGRFSEARPHLAEAGRVALDQHELETARRHLHLALRCIDSEPASEAEAHELTELLLLQAQTLSKMASWDEAFALIDRCLLQSQAWGLQQQEVQAIRWRGRIQYEQGHFDSAVRTLREAQEVATRSEDKLEVHELALQIGNIDFELGRLEAALDGYLPALMFATEVSDTNLEARASNNVAMVYSTMGDKPEAIRMFGRSLKLFRRLKREDAVARIQHNIGMTYLDLHNWSEARNYFRDSVELSVRLGLDEIASVARLEHAETNLRMGRVEEAIPDIDKALALCERRQDPLGTATAYRLQAMVAAHEGNRQEAERLLERSIDRLRGLGETPHLGLALKERGRLRLESGDVTGAAPALEEARRVFESLQTPHEGLEEVIALWELCLNASE